MRVRPYRIPLNAFESQGTEDGDRSTSQIPHISVWILELEGLNRRPWHLVAIQLQSRVRRYEPDNIHGRRCASGSEKNLHLRSSPMMARTSWERGHNCEASCHNRCGRPGHRTGCHGGRWEWKARLFPRGVLRGAARVCELADMLSGNSMDDIETGVKFQS